MFSTSTPKKTFTCRTEESAINCAVCGIYIGSDDRILIAGRSEWNLRGTLARILGGDLQVGKTKRHICRKTCFAKLKKAQKLFEAIDNISKEIKAGVSTYGDGICLKRVSLPTEDKGQPPSKSARGTFEKSPSESGCSQVPVYPVENSNVKPTSVIVQPLPVQFCLPITTGYGIPPELSNPRAQRSQATITKTAQPASKTPSVQVCGLLYMCRKLSFAEFMNVHMKLKLSLNLVWYVDQLLYVPITSLIRDKPFRTFEGRVGHFPK